MCVHVCVCVFMYIGFGVYVHALIQVLMSRSSSIHVNFICLLNIHMWEKLHPYHEVTRVCASSFNQKSFVHIQKINDSASFCINGVKGHCQVSVCGLMIARMIDLIGKLSEWFVYYMCMVCLDIEWSSGNTLWCTKRPHFTIFT